MANGGTDRLVSDGCSGYGWAEWFFPAARDCCVEHDFGGSNGQLLDCLQGVLPPWAYVIAAFCVALMILVRPIYQAVKRPSGLFVQSVVYVARQPADEVDTPMTFALTARDVSRLKKAHPDLRKIVIQAAKITTVPFIVLQADRTIEQQRANVKKGVSKTMRSRHLIGGDGMVYAVDIAPLGPDGKASWAWPLYYKLAPIMKEAARDVKVPVEWGGDWKSFKDGPHWQLPWRGYPGK